MRSTVRAVRVLVIFLLVIPALSQTLPRGVQKLTAVEGITEYTLPNGLHVLLYPDLSKPKVTVNMTYMVGSRHEGYGETGMAHLLEHLLFLQTPTRPNIKKDITDHGADWNGTTSWDRTNYFNTVVSSAENLKWAIALEADRMMNTKMEKAILDTEMTVVRNEFENGENSPQNVLFQRVMEAAFTYHGYGRMPIGARSDIENVPIDRLAAFYHRYYQPDNAVLTIAGKFDESTALAEVVAAFGSIAKPQRVLGKTYTVEPTQDGEREVTLRRVGEFQAIMSMYHVPSATSPDNAALEILGAILGDAPSGRLYKALVDSKKAVSAAAGAMTLHDPGVLYSQVRLRPDQSVEEARAILNKTMEGLVTQPPTKEEVERARTRILKQVDLNLTNTERVGLTLSESIAAGDWRLLFFDRDETKKVTEADVLRVAKAYLKSSNRTLGVFVPTPTPDRAVVAPAPEVSSLLKDFKGGVAVAAGEAFDPSPANIEGRVNRSKIPSGLKVVLLPKQTRGGTVVATLTLRFGDEKALFGKSTAASMAGALLIRGTKKKNRQQIQDEIDRLKARINVGGATTNATASIETVEANLGGSLRLVAELLREPAFPESEFDQIKQQRLSGIEASRTEPTALASLEVQRRFNTYPRGDVRYVSNFDEQLEDLKKVTLEDARQFYTSFYGASTGELVISGQFNKAEALKLAEELFGSFKSPAPFQRVFTNYQKVEPLDKKIETPDKQNAMIFAGLTVKMSDDHADYPALILANYIYGGSGASRLFKRVRDKEGLSYGVGSGLGVPAKQDRATFTTFAICAPQNAPKAEASLRDELARTVKDGFTAEEVADAKKSWLQEQSVGRTQDQFMARMLGSHEYNDRTMKFDEALEAKVAALTAEQVSAAFRRHIDPAAMTYVKAGDFKKAGAYQAAPVTN